MCYHPVKVNSVSGHGATFSFVPCGKCEECRQSSKNAWSFRLCAEIEQRVRDGWHVGFCTLTVDDDHMSYLDRNFLKIRIWLLLIFVVFLNLRFSFIFRISASICGVMLV